MAFWPSGGFGDSTQVGFKLFTIFVERWVINGQRGSEIARNAKVETKLHSLGESLVPPLYINRKMFFILFSATIGLLLLNEKRYEPAVFAKS